MAERIRAQVEATTIELSPGHRDRVTVSIGVAIWPSDADERVKLLQVADAALYRAKNSGRNRVVFAAEEFTERGASRDAAEPGGDVAVAGEGTFDDDPRPASDPVPRPIGLPRTG